MRNILVSRLLLVIALGSLGCGSDSPASTSPVSVTVTGEVSRNSLTFCSYYVWLGIFHDAAATTPVAGYDWSKSPLSPHSAPFTDSYSMSATLPPGTYYAGGLHASQDCLCGPCTGYDKSMDPWATAAFTVRSGSTTISGVNISIP